MGPYNYVVATLASEEDAEKIRRAISWAGDYTVRIQSNGPHWQVVADGQCCEGTEDYFHGWRAAFSYARLVGVPRETP